MNGFFKTGRFRALAVVFVALLCLSMVTYGKGASAAGSVFSLISTPMQKVSASVADSVKEAVSGQRYTDADYEALLEENRQLREQLVDYYELKQKNAQYESILGFQSEHEDFTLVSAAVISRDPGDSFYGFTIDKGSRAGLHESDCVITADGLVGLVTTVYPNSAKVTTLYSPNIHISAVSKEWRESGVTSCDIQLADKSLLKLNYLTRDTQLAKNTIITTSGISGTYPADLIIGKVTSLYYSETDASVYAVLSPYADIKNVTDVFVITDFAGKGQTTDDFGFSASSDTQDDTASQTQSGADESVPVG